jgi:glutamine amidotransferase
MGRTSPRVAVVDYGAGNLRSVAKALERSGMRADLCRDPASLRGADGIVLPGVGAFADAAGSLRSKGLDETIMTAIEDGRPYLGLCLGLQLLFEESDEHGSTPGFGLLPGRIERFGDRDGDGRVLRVPHIGWNTVRFEGSHPMLEGLPAEDCFYFVHSYRAVARDPSQVVGTADYGGLFAAAVAKDSAFAVQFHPEKSQSSGKHLLDAYSRWMAAC